MLPLAGGLLSGTVPTPEWSARGSRLTIEAVGRTLEAGAFPRYSGTTHLCSIRGVVASLSVRWTAFGPVAFAVVQDATGSHGPALVAGAALLLVAVAALLSPRSSGPVPRQL